jgi:hypothetical protein
VNRIELSSFFFLNYPSSLLLNNSKVVYSSEIFERGKDEAKMDENINERELESW